MVATALRPTRKRRLKIWQQNLNKSLDAQNDFLHRLNPDVYDMALIQEPHFDFRGVTRANRRWVSVTPPTHTPNQAVTRSLILVNICLPSASWTAIPIPSPDITAVQIAHETFGTLRFINVYNDCVHNNALDVMREYLRTPAAAACPVLPLRYIWAGDFNRHHPLWDEERNHHLFTSRNLELTQPLLDLLGRYRMRMPLPKGIPTLESFATGNYTRVDNVFCSPSLLSAFIQCDTDPASRPVKTDHIPIIQVLDMEVPVVEHVPRPMFRKTDWGEFRKELMQELSSLLRCEHYTSVEDVEEAIQQLDAAIQRAIQAKVPFSKPSPYWKRWYTEALDLLRKESAKLERIAYRWRFAPDHPVHEEARTSRTKFCTAVRVAKAKHWVQWLEELTASGVWKAGKFVSAEATDGSAVRMPTLQRRDPVTKAVVETAVTNEQKTEMLRKEFFPAKMEESSVPPDTVYPPPKWQWETVSDDVLRRAIARMKPYKATYPGSTPNCVFLEASNLLIPFLGPIYRSLDELGHYPQGWADILSLALRKPGKPNYADPAAHRPIVLSKGFARLYNAAKTLQCTTEAELAGIFPNNHYGGRPGRSTTDAIHMVVKIIKDAWRDGNVASVLCMDVKGAFPSVDLDRLVHDMRMRGVPVEHTDWLQRRYASRRSQISFGDFMSEPFDVDGGLDQGDPHSLFAYLVYNSRLAEIPRPQKGEAGVVYVDDDTLITVGRTFKITHKKICDITQRPEGVDDWSDTHNALFGPAKYQLLDASRRTVPHPSIMRKRIPEPRFPLKLGSHTIQSRESVKLLGVHLDRELRWKAQSASAVAKGQAWLGQFARLARPSRGIVASNMRRLYLGICVPRMLYGADIFLKAPHTSIMNPKQRERGVMKQIRTIQRRAALAITGAMSTTPTELLDMYANLLPVTHLVDKLRFGAALRLSTVPRTHPLHDAVANTRHRRTHPTSLDELMAEFPYRPEQMEKIEAVRKKPGWKSSMAVVIPSSKEAALAAEEADDAEWKVYTDGSGIDGRIGAAAVLYRHGVEVSSIRVEVGRIACHTVFEGEGVGGGIGIALLTREPEVRGKVTVVIDSQPAARATTSYLSNPSHWIWDEWHKRCRELLGRHNEVTLTLRWAPGHRDIPGNERADEEAKKAAQIGSSPIDDIPVAYRPTLPYSKSAVRQDFNTDLKAKVLAEWKKSPRYARASQYDNKLHKGSYIATSDRLPRGLAVLLLQLRTGHCPLARHLHRIKKAESPICPCCRQADETVAHYLLHCTAHTDARRELVRAGGQRTRTLSKLLGMPKLQPHLFRYIARTGRFHSVHGDLPDPPDPTRLTRNETIALLNKIKMPHRDTSLPRDADPFRAPSPPRPAPEPP